MVVDASPIDLESCLKPLSLRAQAGHEAAYRQALALIALRLRAHLRCRMARLPDEVEALGRKTLLALHLRRGSYDPTLPQCLGLGHRPSQTRRRVAPAGLLQASGLGLLASVSITAGRSTTARPPTP
jgi:hypothetical protein